MDAAEQLMPAYLRFVRGVIDSNDLPLNVSREILQESKTIEAIRAGCVKRVLTLLEDLSEKAVVENDVARDEHSESRDGENDKYATFWKEFGGVLKEGVAEDYANRERIAKLLRFSSTREEN